MWEYLTPANKEDRDMCEKINKCLESMSLGQLDNIMSVVAQLIDDKQPLVYACTCEGYPIRGCVFDTGDLDDCGMTQNVDTKKDCKHWEKVKESEIQDD